MSAELADDFHRNYPPSSRVPQDRPECLVKGPKLIRGSSAEIPSLSSPCKPVGELSEHAGGLPGSIPLLLHLRVIPAKSPDGLSQDNKGNFGSRTEAKDASGRCLKKFAEQQGESVGLFEGFAVVWGRSVRLFEGFAEARGRSGR
jgi:hypothetical protein